MSSDPWDGLPSGNYQKWETPGDTLVGDVVGRGVGQDVNGNDCPQIVVRTDDGAEITVTAGQAQLKAKLMEARPNPGDRIKITYTEAEKREGGKTLKHFEVVVKRGEAKAPVTDEAVAAAADDF
jgi:hypothetical protein